MSGIEMSETQSAVLHYSRQRAWERLNDSVTSDQVVDQVGLECLITDCRQGYKC